jgi:hypothetical protein
MLVVVAAGANARKQSVDVASLHSVSVLRSPHAGDGGATVLDVPLHGTAEVSGMRDTVAEAARRVAPSPSAATRGSSSTR